MDLTRTANAMVFVFLLSAVASVDAITFPISGRHAPRLSKRAADMDGNFGNGSIEIANFGDLNYASNISLGGKIFEVNIDTGSTDLWVLGDVPGTKNLSVPAALTYGAGEVKGFINTAPLEFDGFSVPDQAYINAINSSNLPNQVGILGLGPSNASTIRSLLNSTAGLPPLDRIFRQNMSTPNFLSVLLSRASPADFANVTTAAPQLGLLSIGEVLEGMDAISAAPKLPALVDQFGTQHWQTLLDGNGIIGPDGKRINTTTGIPNPTVGALDQLHVVFDTGFTFPQVPREVADAIYGRIPGAQFITSAGSLTNFWSFDCTYELNVTFLFAGVEFPISPLDLSLVGQTDEDGNPIMCGGGFQQTIDNVAGNTGFGALDAILGIGFLRNAYLLINFGDFVDGSSESVADPFIQLLSTTNRTEAHLEFVNARLGGIDTTGTQAPLVPPSEAKHSPAGNSTNDSNSTNSSTNNITGSIADDEDDVKNLSSEGTTSRAEDDSTKPFYKEVWFIVVVSAGGALVLGLAGWAIFSAIRHRKSNVRSETAFVPPLVGDGSYKPLLSGPKGGVIHDDDSYHTKYDEPTYNSGGKYA